MKNHGYQLRTRHEDWSEIALAISKTAIAKAISLLFIIKEKSAARKLQGWLREV